MAFKVIALFLTYYTYPFLALRLAIQNYDICSDTVIYTCSIGADFLNWKIKSPSQVLYNLGLTIHDTTGMKHNIQTLESSTVFGEVILANSTFLVSTLTINNSSHLAGNNIFCQLTSKHISYLKNISSAPDKIFFNLTVQGIYISWISSWHSYYFQVSPVLNESHDFMINTSSIMLTPGTVIQNITISLCPGHLQEIFIIDPCLFSVKNESKFKINYIVYPNNSWRIPCRNNDYLLVSNCNTDEYNLCIYSEGKIEGPPNILKMHTLSLQTTLISITVSVVIILLLITTVIIIIGSTLWRKKHKRLSFASNISDTKVGEGPVYEDLDYRQFNKTGDARRNPQIEAPSEGNYSTLNFKMPFVCTNDEYSTIQTPATSNIRRIGNSQYSSVKKPMSHALQNSTALRHPKVNRIGYADLMVCDHCSNIPPDNDKIKYAKLCSNALKADGLLTLDNLLQQLKPISEQFKLFGSVAGISPVSLDQIVAKAESSYDGLAQVCDLWLQNCQKEETSPTWHAVAEILALIGQNELSNNILQVYSTGKLPAELEINSLEAMELPEVSQNSQISEPRCSLQGTNKDYEPMEYDSNQNKSDEALDDESPTSVPSYNPTSSA